MVILLYLRRGYTIFLLYLFRGYTIFLLDLPSLLELSCEAVAAWTQVLGLEDSAQARQGRAAAHAGLGHFEEAERDFAEALRQAESDEDAVEGIERLGSGVLDALLKDLKVIRRVLYILLS